MPGHIINPNEYPDDSLFAPRPPLERCTTVTGRHHNSRAAAADALPRSGTQRRRIFDLIAKHERGLTADDVQRITNLPQNSVNPRVHELAADGWIIDSGWKRETRYGSLATVWVAA